MNKFNVTHNAIVKTKETPSVSNPKNGEKCNHYNRVMEIEFYHQISKNKFSQVRLSREFILDLASQIKRIESNLFEREYFHDPFY